MTNQCDDVAKLAEGLTDLEKEWLTGWQGPFGAAFNVIGTRMAKLGMTVSITNWHLSRRGIAVANHLQQKGSSHD